MPATANASSPDLPLTRREAISRLARLGVLAGTAPAILLPGCSGGKAIGPELPATQPGPVTSAHILGPTRQFLTPGGEPVTYDFEAVRSTGETLLWRTQTPSATVAGAEGETHFSLEVAERGTYRIELTARSTERSDATDRLDLQVHPPLDSPWSSRRRMAFWRVNRGMNELHVRDDYRQEDTRVVVSGGDEMKVDCLSWNPDQTKLVTNHFYPPKASRIVVIDTEEGTIQPITDDLLNSRAFSWSPSGEWIAFTNDDSTAARYDTLYIIRPDGSDRLQIGGIDSDPALGSVQAAAWTLDEQALVVGAQRFGTDVRSIGVYSDLHGKPTVERLFSDETLAAFFASHEDELGPVDPTFPVSCGSNGAVCIHPDGNTVFFGIDFATQFGVHRWTVSAPLDGNSGIREIARFAGRATVSPDGNFLFVENTLFTGTVETDIPTWAIGVVAASGGPVRTLIADLNVAPEFRRPTLTG